VSGCRKLTRLGANRTDDYGALEPYISGQIMELHHSKHHQTYVNGLNAAVDAIGEAAAKGDSIAAAAQAPLLNFHGGGHLNHTLFWENLAPHGKGGGGEPEGKLLVSSSSPFRFPSFPPLVQYC
jgi:superoxide dismutase, Fe-Mn family